MELFVGELPRVHELPAQGAQLQTTQQVACLIERAVPALERSPDLRGGVVALVAYTIHEKIDALLR